MECWKRSKVKSNNIRRRRMTIPIEIESSLAEHINDNNNINYDGDDYDKSRGYDYCCGMSRTLFNQRNDQAAVQLIYSIDSKESSDFSVNNNNCRIIWRSKRWKIIAGVVVLAVIAIVIVAVLLSKGSKKIDENDDDVEKIPDVEKYQPPSSSKLSKFKRGAVCVDDAYCADVGGKILERNGSAVDAAIAAALCNGMANMQNMGLGGAFVMTVYDKTSKKAYYLNARDRAPMAAYGDMYRNKSKDASFTGPLAVAIPGEIAGYWAAHQRFGKLPWADLFTDAIAMCKNGWKLSNAQWSDLFKNKASIEKDPTLRSLFVNETTKEFKKPGSIIKADTLCKTYKVLAEKGADEFYNGTLGRTLIEDLQKHGGILTMNDLSTYSAKWQEPLETELSNGLKLFTSNFPTSGALLIFIMNIFDEFKFNPNSLNGDENTIKTYHRMLETFKYAYAVRSKLGDPEFHDMTELANNLTSRDYAREIKARINDSRTWNDAAHYEGGTRLLEDHGTAQISVVSPDGDAVSITSTLNTFFGSGLVSENTGILLNSGMDDFSIPYIINYFDLPGNAKENLIEPGKRPFSSMVPSVLVDSNGDLRMVIGSCGGTKITTSAAFVMARTLWMNNTIKEAIDAPRIHHQLYPMKVGYQYGVLKSVVEGLQKLGHKTARYRGRGSVVCAIEKLNDLLYGNADYRRNGGVSGIN
ncbi:scoloptoxin SSD14-like isoform X1 [Cotesia typhae]|uniref:scoloptoxin SSD14-like isoform X1 n=1 Tax=Cotesia typhae TaxID=2053667 RepID=UPI003D68674C